MPKSVTASEPRVNLCVCAVKPHCLRLGIARAIIKWHSVTKTDAASNALMQSSFFLIDLLMGLLYAYFFPHSSEKKLTKNGTIAKGCILIQHARMGTVPAEPL